MPSPKVIPAHCASCEERFLTSKSRINAGHGKFCSISCSITHRNKQLKISTEDLFWSNVRKNDNDECWIYTKCISTGGYGRIQINQKFIMAHRFSYEMHFGSIPASMFVCHKCDNPPCVNPFHLFLGTALDNNLDKLTKNRTIKGSNHWKSKLNAEQVMDIKKSLENGSTGYELAAKYGVHHQTIYSIKSNHNWPWLKNECNRY